MDKCACTCINKYVLTYMNTNTLTRVCVHEYEHISRSVCVRTWVSKHTLTIIKKTDGVAHWMLCSLRCLIGFISAHSSIQLILAQLHCLLLCHTFDWKLIHYSIPFNHLLSQISCPILSYPLPSYPILSYPILSLLQSSCAYLSFHPISLVGLSRRLHDVS